MPSTSIRSVSRDVTFDGGGCRLAGTLWLPAGAGPHPGVVMVGGSGPSTRDNDTLFPPIRAHLVDAGFAVLAYDKRGVGESGGSWLESTLDDFAADALGALGVLRAEAGVSAPAVGLFGHSEGGWVVLRAAAGRDDVPFVVTNAGPGTTPAVQDRHSLAGLLRSADEPAERVDACLALFDELVAAGRREAPFTEVSRLLADAPGYQVLLGYGLELGEREWEFTRRKQDHDPVADVLRLRCPHLAVFGGADRLVPVPESAAIFAAAACAPGHAAGYDLTVRVFPSADHRLRMDDGGFAPGYLTALTDWIGAAVAGRATGS